MLVLSPSLLVVLGILATAVAQIVLKKASYFEIRTPSWIILMGVSALSYAMSFVVYSRVLKYYPLNKIYPVMTVAQIIVITLYGLVIGEFVNGRQVMGLLCGVLAIYLILS